MKRLPVCLLLLLLSGCGAPAVKPVAATLPAPAVAATTAPVAQLAGPTVTLDSLSVRSARHDAVLALFGSGRRAGLDRRPTPAVTAALHLAAPDLNIITLQAMNLTGARDETGRSYSVSNQAIRRWPTFDDPITKDGHHVFAVANIIDPPAPGITDLVLEGAFSVRTGSGLTSAKQQVAVRVGSSFTVDHTSYTILETEALKDDRPDLSVRLKVEGPTDHIHSLEFVAPDGQVLANRPWRIDEAFSPGDPVVHWYLLAHPVENVTVQASWFKQQQSMTIPFALRTSIGLPLAAGAAAPATQPKALPVAALPPGALIPEILDLALVRGLSEKQAERLFPGNGFSKQRRGQTAMTLYVALPEPLLALPTAPLELTSVSDDLGTDLLRGPDASAYLRVGARSSFDTAPISQDRRGLLIDLSLPGQPAAGARTITLRGTLKFPASDGDVKTEQHKNIPLAIGTTIPAGPLKLTVAGLSLYNGQMAMSLRADELPDAIQKIEFLDAAGNAVQATSSNDWRSQRMNRPDDPSRYLLSYQFTGVQDALTFRITYFEKTQAKSYPVSLTTSLGLAAPATQPGGQR